MAPEWARKGSRRCADALVSRPTIPRSRSLFSEVLVEEIRDVGEGLLGLRRVRGEGKLRVGLTFIDIQIGFDSGAAQLAVRAHGVAEEQIARAGGEDSRWETAEVAINRR